MLLAIASVCLLATVQDRAVTFASFDDLRSARPPADGAQAMVAAYYPRGQRGGGTFVFDATATDPDDAGVFVRPATTPEARPGRWKRTFNGPVDLDFYGLREERDLIVARENDRRIAAAYRTALRLKPKWSYSVTFSLGSGGMASVSDTVVFYQQDQATDLDLVGTLFLSPVDIDWSGRAVVHFKGIDASQTTGHLGVQNRVPKKVGYPACAFAVTRNEKGDHHTWAHFNGLWADGGYTLATLVHAAGELCLYEHLVLSNEGPGAVVYIGNRLRDGFSPKGSLVGLSGQSTTRVTVADSSLMQADRAQDPDLGNEDRSVVLVQGGVADITFRDCYTAIGRGTVFDIVSGRSGDARNFVVTGSTRHESYVWTTGAPRRDGAKSTDRFFRAVGVPTPDLRLEGLNASERFETLVELRDVGRVPGVRISNLTSETTSASVQLLLAGLTTLAEGSDLNLGAGFLQIDGPQARAQGVRAFSTSPAGPLRLTGGAQAAQALAPDLRNQIEGP